MQRIEKKVWPEFFEKILSGDKTYELRLADWNCEEGDILILHEWDPKAKEYTGRSVEKKISHILKTKNIQFWPKEEIDKHGFQILSIRNKKDYYKLYCAVYLYIKQDNKILMQLRQNTYADGKYGIVSGHVDGHETFKEATKREAKEEADINVNIDDLEIIHTQHRLKNNDGLNYCEYMDIYFKLDNWDGYYQNLEPHKCKELAFFDIDNLPENTIPYLKKTIELIEKGETFSELHEEKDFSIKMDK